MSVGAHRGRRLAPAPTAGRRRGRTRRIVIHACSVVLVAALIPISGVTLPDPLAVIADPAEPAWAAARTMGTGPLADMRNIAAQQPMCSGLTPDKLASMAMTPTFSETGAPTNRAPSPMTLSRWDNQSTLYAFGSPGTADKAFFHPGVGMWQFDSAGGWNLTAAGAINTGVSAMVALPLLRQRFCAASGTDQERRRYAWGPWFGCTSGTACEDTYNSLLVNGVLTIDQEAVDSTGGMELRTCNVQGIGTVTCGYVDPAKAQGYKGFTTFPPGNGVSPLTAPFYVFEAGGREYRYWLKVDTGYAQTIEADKVVTANARTGLTWRYNDNLCDVTAQRGSCGTTPPSTWSPVYAFGGSTRGEVGTGLNADGRLELFVIGPDGQLWHTWQTQPNGGWWTWVPMGGSYPLTARPAVAKNKDGRMEVFVRGNSNELWHAFQTIPNGGWSPHYGMGGTLSDDPTVGANADGRIELFARFTNGQIWHAWQVAPNLAFESWATMSGDWPTKTRLALAVNSDGRMELFGVAYDKQVWHAWQVAPNLWWTGWAPLGGSWPLGCDVAAARNQDGRIEMFAVQSDGRLWHTFQWVPNGWWSNLEVADTNLWSTAPAVIRDRSGRIDLAAIMSNGQLGVKNQIVPNGGWTAVQALGGSGGTQPILVANSDGHLEAFYVATNTAINHAWQLSPP